MMMILLRKVYIPTVRSRTRKRKPRRNREPSSLSQLKQKATHSYVALPNGRRSQGTFFLADYQGIKSGDFMSHARFISVDHEPNARMHLLPLGHRWNGDCHRHSTVSIKSFAIPRGVSCCSLSHISNVCPI